jgi:hypothetical protein
MHVSRSLTEQNVCARLAAGRRRRTGVLWPVWTDQGALSTAGGLWFRDVERFLRCYVLARLDSPTGACKVKTGGVSRRLTCPEVA